MDPELSKEVLDVRRAIEKNTSKVSLRDLEKKGFRQVKVLRAGDINQMIFKAVQSVMAKQPRGGMTAEERERIVNEARGELDRQMAEKRALEQQKVQIEEARRRLEEKVNGLNQQIMAEKTAFQREKEAFTRDKQALMERSLEGQQVAAKNYEGQLQDLRQRLARAEAQADAAAGGISRDEHEAQLAGLRTQLARAAAKAEAADGAVSQEEHEKIRARYETQIEDLEGDVERYRKQARRVAELEEGEARAQGRARSLAEEVERLEAQVAKLREELAAAGAAKGKGVDDAELQRIRMEFEQRESRMQEMLSGIANSLVEARNVAPAAASGGASDDMLKQFQRLQMNITDAVRKAAGSNARDLGFDLDLTAEQAGAIFAAQDEIKLETNIQNIEVKEKRAGGVSDKLAKLRNLRKK